MTRDLIIDSFAGGGGASMGIELAIGRPVDLAINHDANAIAMHAMNHPATEHLQEDVWGVDPQAATKGRAVALAWWSPDCTHHSKARGGKPVEKSIRGLAWVALRWAAKVRPRVMIVENVEEFQTWGPLNRHHRPKRNHKGETFRRWVEQLRGLGYEVEWRELRACDYGAPTIRKRLFIIARCDGERIRWPLPTHGRGMGLLPYRTAAECIDFSLPCPSIFLTREEGRALGVNRPLVDATMRRIAAGIKRFVIDNPHPFIVPLTHHGGARVESLEEPMMTVTGANRGEKALITPYLAGITHNKSGGQIAAIDVPVRTVTTSKGGEQALIAPYVVRTGSPNSQARPSAVDEPLATVMPSPNSALIAPTLIQQGWGERAGQAPRALAIEAPIGTLVGGGGKHALVSAFLAKHFTGQIGAAVSEPLPTITARNQTTKLIASNLVKLYGTNGGADVQEPMPTVTAGGQHIGQVSAFLGAYYGNEKDGAALDDPFRTVTSKERFALVYVDGQPYAIVDIGMRMLTPRELFRAQGFPEGYIIDRGAGGKRLTKTAQIEACGNSVCPPIARALVAANVAGNLGQRDLWRGYEASALAAAGGAS